MNVSQDSETHGIVQSAYPALAVIAFGLAALSLAWGYGEVAGKVPILVAGLMIILGLFDLGSRTRMPLKDFFIRFWGADFRNKEMKFSPALARETAIIGWVIGCTAGMLLIGILPTIPIFCFFYIIIEGKRPWLESAIITSAFISMVYIVFEMLLNYELYRGAFFTKLGFGGW